MEGRIHSLESFGTVDGPGVRFVIFFQGCTMRCKYCHNPDTWKIGSGTVMTVDEIWKQFERNKEFYTNGGITATGGEPLLQLPFLIELFEKAKSKGIHTCLDTSGISYSEEKKDEFNRLFAVTDLVMLDLKCSDPAKHKALTTKDLSEVLAFADALQEAGVKLRIRHVIVPGLTYDEKLLRQLGRLIAKYDNLTGIEVLPYHTMGLTKYEALGMEYPLKGVPQLSKDEAKQAREIIIHAMQHERKRNKKI
jgi:pyruvate formate lyase activating enzyme